MQGRWAGSPPPGPIRRFRRAVVVAIAASFSHFLQNSVQLHRFPGPEWVSGPDVIWGAWGVMALGLLAGSYAIEKGRWPLGLIGLGVFCAGGLSVFGHYLYGAISDFTRLMHLGIWGEGLATALLIGATYHRWCRRADEERALEAELKAAVLPQGKAS